MKNLPEDFKEKWLVALRSGKYPQTSHVLYRPQIGFCCLGVAGKVCGIDESQMVGKTSLHDFKGLVPENLTLCSANTMADFLMRMNDDGKSFSQIADYIEKNL